MKILVIGDLAGDFEMLSRVMEDVGLWKPDLVLFTGDVVGGAEREKLWGDRAKGKAVPVDWQNKLKKVLAGEAASYRRFMEEMARFRGTVRVVPGHRDAPFENFLRSALRDADANSHVGLVHQSFINAGRDFVLVGFGGDITPDERETGLVNRFPAWEMAYHFEVMQHLPQEPILLTHYPPLAEEIDLVDGEHVGSPELRDLIESYRPAYVFCGHAVGSQGIEAVGDSVVINPGTLTEGNYAILNTRKETVRFNMLED
jgi:Icc-related predicted phosphoesterase